MDKLLQEVLWKQLGASIDMLINVIATCPEHYLATNKRFYFLAYHSTIFLDYYLTIPPESFSPLLPFTTQDQAERPEEAVDDLIPDKIYSKQELVDYLNASRLKSESLIARLTHETILNLRFTEGNEPDAMDYPIVEILLYNLRHTQHHVGQLNLMMRQDLKKHMEWSFRAGDLNPGYQPTR